ncbi:MAG TPA: histidine phosphatase family protein [Rubricoccaceae bacterium]|nr:histidine phosphatase family protein [Rubricoccaceae bacterium]
MPSVLLLRHGKSDWTAEYGADAERPLNKRGEKAARRVGRYLADAGLLPDRALTSTAVRAKETLRRAMKAAEWGGPVHETESLYEASPDTVTALLRALPDDTALALVVGHEPTLSDTVHRLTGANVDFPTAALARIDFEGETWRDVRAGAGTLALLLPPRLLPK